jgi:shikimate kinase
VLTVTAVLSSKASKATERFFLVGFMGTGKTTLGRQVAERMGLPFVDLDERIERSAG